MAGGKTQTPYRAGLRVYQWIAIINIVLGAICTSVHDSSILSSQFSIKSLFYATGVSILAMIASGVDFPASSRRFARLTSI